MIQDYDYLFKIVLVGNQAVGKSSIFARFNDKKFADTYLTTVGVDFRFQVLDVDGSQCKLQIWDTAGQERFRAITSAYYKGSHAVLMVYDLTDNSSFEAVQTYWYPEVKRHADPSVTLALVGNKCDLEWTVTPEQVDQITTKFPMKDYKISAKIGSGVDQLFMDVCRKLIEKAPKKNQAQCKLTNKEENLQKNSGNCC